MQSCKYIYTQFKAHNNYNAWTEKSNSKSQNTKFDAMELYYFSTVYMHKTTEIFSVC